MPLSLPGALAAVVADLVTGAVTVTSAAGETMSAGSVAPGTKAWLDEWGRVVLEAPNGEQIRVGNVAGAPADPVYRGGGLVNGAAGGDQAALQLGRRWSRTITTAADGSATVTLPPGLFGTVWAVNATVLSNTVRGFVSFTGLSAAAVALQVWAGTGVLLGGETLAKPTAAVQVLLEVSGPAPTPTP